MGREILGIVAQSPNRRHLSMFMKLEPASNLPPIFKRGEKVRVNNQEDFDINSNCLFDLLSKHGSTGTVTSITSTAMTISFLKVPFLLCDYRSRSKTFVVCKTLSTVRDTRMDSTLSRLSKGPGTPGGAEFFSESLLRLLLTEHHQDLLAEVVPLNFLLCPFTPSLNQCQINCVIRCLQQKYLALIQGPPGMRNVCSLF